MRCFVPSRRESETVDNEQVQKDLELVLGYIVAHTGDWGGVWRAAHRLRSVKLVAVEEPPEGVPQIMYGEKLWQTGHLDHWDCDPDPSLFGKPNTLHVWRYTGTVRVDENGKVEG